MKKFILLALTLVAFPLFAAKPPSGGGGSVTTPWFQTQWTSSGAWVPVGSPASSGNIAQFTFPFYTYRSSGRLVTSFLTTTSITNVLGNLTGKTVSATCSIVAFFGTEFAYGGMLNNRGDGPGWNTGTSPANFRFFFSTNAATYSNTTADQNQMGYWWSNPVSAVVDDLTGTVTITESLGSINWSNSQGIPAANAFSSFLTATANVRQIGIAFGGGSFFDVGVGVLQDTGSAKFYLNSFTVQ